MKCFPPTLLRSMLGGLLGTSLPFASAQLEIVPAAQPTCVFAGANQRVPVTWHNRGAEGLNRALSIRVYQATSATAVALAEAPWKRLQVLPGQVVLESATFDFPPVKAETSFLFQWLEGTNRVLGTTDVLAFPPDLLKDLRTLAGQEPLGVLDPANQLKPLLQAAGVGCQDLEETGLENYHGRLAILGPFPSRALLAAGLTHCVKMLAGRGVAVVWIQPPPEQRETLKPSFYTVPEGKAAVVVVQADLTARLADSPQAQLNLIQFARLALQPEPPRLPALTSSP